MNYLYYGDNLDVMRRHIKDETVDLVYLDPPFNSDQDYNVLFAEANGAKSKSQIKVFQDTWVWNEESALMFQELIERGGQISQALQAFKMLLGTNDMLAYLSMMAPRLIELQRVLKPTGSIYLHCDPTASHYLKVLMDAIFGVSNFLNEIIWHYRKWPAGKYVFQRNHDVLLLYAKTKSRERAFNQIYMERAPSTLKRFGTAKIVSGYDEDGARMPAQMANEDSEGVRQDDVWDIGRVPPIKQLFPTQKPEPLLERILRVSTDEGDVVLDPFCGCGTTILVSHKMKRQWIGIDVTCLATTLIKHRLLETFGSEVTQSYKVIGEPVSFPEAETLAAEDPYQFQWWALGLVGARPVEQKKGADKGIDGRLYFHDAAGKTQQVIFSVKAGNATSAHLRDLRGVTDRESAAIGVLISMQEPTRPMKTEAATAGFYEFPGFAKKYPKFQILTVKDLFEGKTVNMPPMTQRKDLTYKSASDRTHYEPELDL